MSSKNVHTLGKKLFAAKIKQQQEIYKERYSEHLDKFMHTGDRALSRLFNALSAADIVQQYYTQSAHTQNITRIFPLHENQKTPWIALDTACEELQTQSKALDEFREALHAANMDLDLEIIEKKPARKNDKPQYHFSVKFTDNYGHNL